jgi:hypothetical protein
MAPANGSTAPEKTYFEQQRDLLLGDVAAVSNISLSAKTTPTITDQEHYITPPLYSNA